MPIKCMRSCLAAAIFLYVTGCASSQQPQTTYDGLELDTTITRAEVYKKPGASLVEYKEYGLVPCQVSFKKNWLRDQNRQRLDFSSRVTQKDVDRIKDTLGVECDTFFRAALEQDPAYKLVESFSEGEQVLILRPALINLDIVAPDTMSAGRSRTYTTSAGEMTLLLEVVDGTTHETLYRVVDRKRGLDTGRLQWSNSVTNKADADRALRYWSGQLRKALDSAHES